MSTLNGGLATARDIAGVLTQRFGEDLNGVGKKRTSDLIVAKRCPTGLVACDPQEARRSGLECPIPELAGQEFYIGLISGELCTKPDQFSAMRKLLPEAHGSNVDSAIEVVSAKIMEMAPPEKLATIITTLSTHALAGGNSPLVVVDLPGREQLSGGESASERRSTARREASSAALTAHVEDVKSKLYDPNTIAVFRTEECPVNYGSTKKAWVKARGSYAECEKRMGFRWVSPSGHCYPEGLCAIPEHDLVASEEALKDKMMLLVTITKTYNTLLKEEREEFLKKARVTLTEAKKKELDAKLVGVTDGEVFAEMKAANNLEFAEFERIADEKAREMLPQRLMYLPETAVINRTNELLKASANLISDYNYADEIKMAKQAFIQAYSKDIAAVGGDAAKVLGDKVKTFVLDSVFCAQANIAFPNTSGSVPRDDMKYKDKNIKATCTFITLPRGGGFYMPKLAADRGENGGNATKDTPQDKIENIRSFGLGKDPLATAFRYISDKLLERTENESRHVSSYMSPRRA